MDQTKLYYFTTLLLYCSTPILPNNKFLCIRSLHLRVSALNNLSPLCGIQPYAKLNPVTETRNLKPETQNMFPLPLPISLIWYIAAGMMVAGLLLTWATRLPAADAGWRWRGWATPALGIGWGGLLGVGLVAWLRLLIHLGNYLPIPAAITPTDWLLLVALAPVAEEIFFRGAIYGNLQRNWSPFWAVFLSAIIYTAVHSPEPWIAVTFFTAVGYTLAFRQSGSLITAILAHAIAVSALLASRVYPGVIVALPLSYLGMVGGGCVVLVLIAGWGQKKNGV